MRHHDYRPPRDAVRRLWAERIAMVAVAGIVLALLCLLGGSVVR